VKELLDEAIAAGDEDSSKYNDGADYQEARV